MSRGSRCATRRRREAASEFLHNLLKGWRQWVVVGCRAGWDDGFNVEHDLGCSGLAPSRHILKPQGDCPVRQKFLFGQKIEGSRSTGTALLLGFMAGHAGRVISPRVVRRQLGGSRGSCIVARAAT